MRLLAVNWEGIGVVRGSCMVPKMANTLAHQRINPTWGHGRCCQQAVARESTPQRRSMYPWTLKHVAVPQMPQLALPPCSPPLRVKKWSN